MPYKDPKAHRKEKREYDKLYQQKPDIKFKKKEYIKNYKKTADYKIKRSIRHNERMRNDIAYVLERRLRNKQYKLVKGLKNYKHSLDLLGCTIEEWKLHLITTFTEGMTWDKVMSGDIHVDHKIPCCAFDLRDINQQKICFNWKNTQCLWAEDNLEKSVEDKKLDWDKL